MAFDSEQLDDILDHLWVHLETATRSAKPPFHLPTLCNIDPAGRPDGRIVVLRRVERQTRRLMCHTDARSPKARAFRERPHACWVFYDAPAKVQLRVTGTVTLRTDDAVADAQWDASSPSSRRCYLAPSPPGELSETVSPNLPPGVRGRVPTAEESAAGRRNFAVVDCRVERFDWLYLHHAGHRRARFVWAEGDATPTADWLEV
ncbi:MAG: pyridoxamine 5'-phosphate oxidase family protein [Planctomycetota bacterium]